MPRKKKRPIDWTTKEAMKKLFPKKVRDAVDKEIGKEPTKPQVKSENVPLIEMIREAKPCVK